MNPKSLAFLKVLHRQSFRYLSVNFVGIRFLAGIISDSFHMDAKNDWENLGWS